MKVGDKIGGCPHAHKYVSLNFMFNIIYQSKVMTVIDHLKKDEWTHHNRVKNTTIDGFGSHNGSFF